LFLWPARDRSDCMKRILLIALGLLVLGAAVLGIAIWRAVSPTTGPRIDAGRTGKALVLIDLQEDYTGPNAKQAYADPVRLISAANDLLAAAQAGGWPVFLVRVAMPDDWLHALMSGGTAIVGTRGAEFDARLQRPPGFVEIVKTKSDAFAVPALDAQLAAGKIGTLYIAGLDAAYCVKTTISGARNRGYAVNVVHEAIATSHGTPLAELEKGYEAKGAVVKSLAQAKLELAAR